LSDSNTYAGFGTTSNWVRGVHGSLGHHPCHRHRHQPRQKLRPCCHIQQRESMGWPGRRYMQIFHFSFLC